MSKNKREWWIVEFQDAGWREWYTQGGYEIESMAVAIAEALELTFDWQTRTTKVVPADE